ncbi:MAG: type II toxin-antitoxin system RelB/DinJ family antitoxin [Ruminococcus sp.]|nr:type II toxin-antitoxin system RelB/DinJ family antitoxin [Ruminococcus sp.]
MATKSANLYARIEPDVKLQAESILEQLGIPASNAITMFYKQIILHRGIPFDVKLPSGIIDMSRLSQEELNAEINKGYEDMIEGRVVNSDTAFDRIRKKHGI